MNLSRKGDLKQKDTATFDDVCTWDFASFELADWPGVRVVTVHCDTIPFSLVPHLVKKGKYSSSNGDLSLQDL